MAQGMAIMNKLRVLHVQVIPKLYGAQTFSLELLSRLSEDKYDKYVLFSNSEFVTPEQRHEIVDRFSENHVQVLWMDTLKRNIGAHDISFIFDFIKLIKQYRFDIIHTNSTKPGISARIIARLMGVKRVIHTVHGIAYHSREPLIKRFLFYVLELFSTPFSHVTVSVNNYYLKYYRWLPFVDVKNIYNGVDFSLLEKKALGSERANIIQECDNSIKVLFVGRLDNQKDPMTLLRAMKILIEKNANPKLKYSLSIVGDGVLESECRKFCFESNINEHVSFKGWVRDPYKYYLSADIFVMPSIYEALGYTFIEAAFFGLPIVATNVEGIPEVVIHKEMGLLVEPSSPQALADALQSLASDKSMREKFSRYGQEFVRKRFDMPEMMRCYEELYKMKS